jgi:hypothetical protein
MESDLPNLFGLLYAAVLIGRDPATPPPAFGLIYEGATGQPKQTTSLCTPLLQQLLPLLSIIRLEKGEGIVDILDGVGLGREFLDKDPLPPHQLGHAQRAEKDAHFEQNTNLKA